MKPVDPLAPEGEAHEQWLLTEISRRAAELRADPSSTLPAERVFADLEVYHLARVAKARA
jgi:hypothetical protein